MMIIVTVYMYINPYQKFYINVLEVIITVDLLILLLIALIKVCKFVFVVYTVILYTVTIVW